MNLNLLLFAICRCMPKTNPTLRFNLIEINTDLGYLIQTPYFMVDKSPVLKTFACQYSDMAIMPSTGNRKLHVLYCQALCLHLGRRPGRVSRQVHCLHLGRRPGRVQCVLLGQGSGRGRLLPETLHRLPGHQLPAKLC